MRRRPPRSTRTDTFCPYTTLFRSPARTVDPLYAADRAGAGTPGSVRRMDSVLGVGAATESRIRFSWRAARHDGSADRRRVAGDHRRSAARRVGQEWVSTFRSRWTAYHYKKKLRIYIVLRLCM